MYLSRISHFWLRTDSYSPLRHSCLRKKRMKVSCNFRSRRPVTSQSLLRWSISISAICSCAFRPSTVVCRRLTSALNLAISSLWPSWARLSPLAVLKVRLFLILLTLFFRQIFRFVSNPRFSFSDEPYSSMLSILESSFKSCSLGTFEQKAEFLF